MTILPKFLRNLFDGNWIAVSVRFDCDLNKFFCCFFVGLKQFFSKVARKAIPTYRKRRKNKYSSNHGNLSMTIRLLRTQSEILLTIFIVHETIGRQACAFSTRKRPIAIRNWVGTCCCYPLWTCFVSQKYSYICTEDQKTRVNFKDLQDRL